MSINFIIFASQRTGSNMLVSVLDTHPDVRCHGELFRRNNVGMKGALKALKMIDSAFESADYRDEHHDGYISAVRKAEKDNHPIFGFKLMLNQADHARASYLANPDYRKIILRRDNLLAIYSSNLIVRETGQGNVKADQHVTSARVEFKKKGFVRFLEKHNSKYKEVRSQLQGHGGKDFLDISYLDICTQAGINRVFDFIGADPSLCAGLSATLKRNTSKIIERFSNPEAVEACLTEMGHLDWLEEQ